MSFSGNIEDVSIADTLQFIHLGGRSGTLRLVCGEEKAQIGFHHGRIVQAWSPGSKRLGELLMEAGIIDQTALETALATQQGQHPRKSLGQILVSMGALEADAIYKTLERQIQGTVRDLVAWSRGTFEFDLDDLRPMDEVAVYPGDVVNLHVDTQMVLLDALRLFDERNRDAQAAPPNALDAPTAPIRPPTNPAQRPVPKPPLPRPH
jgi:hypothetical protein